MQKDTEPGTGDRGPKGPKFCPQEQIKEEAYAINKTITFFTNKEELSMGKGTPLGNCQAWGSAPVSYHRHFYIYRFP